MEAEKTKLISLLTETIEKGLDVAPDYVVDLVHRYATYKIIGFGIGFAVCFTIMIILTVYLIRGIREEDEDVIGFCAAVGVVLLGITIGCGTALLQAIFVPEIALIHSL